MITTGRTANALRKKTTWPSGTISPSQRISADITANSSAEASLRRMPLTTSTGQAVPLRSPDRRRIGEGAN